MWDDKDSTPGAWNADGWQRRLDALENEEYCKFHLEQRERDYRLNPRPRPSDLRRRPPDAAQARGPLTQGDVGNAAEMAWAPPTPGEPI